MTFQPFKIHTIDPGEAPTNNEETEKLRAELKACQKERETLLKDREHLQNNCTKYKDDLAKEAAFRKQFLKNES